MVFGSTGPQLRSMLLTPSAGSRTPAATSWAAALVTRGDAELPRARSKHRSSGSGFSASVAALSAGDPRHPRREAHRRGPRPATSGALQSSPRSRPARCCRPYGCSTGSTRPTSSTAARCVSVATRGSTPGMAARTLGGRRPPVLGPVPGTPAGWPRPTVTGHLRRSSDRHGRGADPASAGLHLPVTSAPDMTR